jgi:hypothetical protein
LIDRDDRILYFSLNVHDGFVSVLCAVYMLAVVFQSFLSLSSRRKKVNRSPSALLVERIFLLTQLVALISYYCTPRKQIQVRRKEIIARYIK